METEPGNGSILKNLAQDMLSKEENSLFKDALQKYRKSASLTSLVSQLTKVIKDTEKLMLLVELSNVLPGHLRKDFHKLCCLHFPEYESFLTYFTPGTVGERSRIITQDPTGQFQVVSSGADDKAHFNFQKSDQTSLPGESGIDVNSDIDDICRHSDHNNNANNLGPTWRIESRSGRSSSTSSHVSRSTNRTPTPKNSLSGSQQLQQSWKQSSHSDSHNNKTQIRNRARQLRVLSGSLPSVVAPQDNTDTRPEGKMRILLKRHEDGSLGIGIKGGKEFGKPIVVYLVDPASQAASQGLRVGDHILDVNGTDFNSITHAEAVTMMRNAWNIIMIIQRPEVTEVGGQGSPYRWGKLAFEEFQVFLYPSKKGKLGCGVFRDDRGHLVVKNVEKNSAASKAGLWKHDRFVEIEGMKVASLTDKQVASLTNVKRMRIKINRFTGSTSSKGRGSITKSSQFDFESVMSLDLCPLGLGDDDIVSSTPRCPPGRSQSADGRHLVAHSHSQPQQLQQHHNHHQHPNNYHLQNQHGQPHEIINPREQEDEPSMELITQTVQVDVHCSKSPRENIQDNGNGLKEGHTNAVDGLDGRGVAEMKQNHDTGIERTEEQIHSTGSLNQNGSTDKENQNGDRRNEQMIDKPGDWDHQSETTPTATGARHTDIHSSSADRHGSPVRRHHSQPHPQANGYPYSQSPRPDLVQHHQPRIYRPRVAQQSHSQHVPQQTAAHHPKRSLARYMHPGHSNAASSALPSRAAMVYSPTPFMSAGEHDRSRSRTKKRSSTHNASAASKMRQLRNRSQSPHAIQLQNNQSRGREFLRAIQNSVERRQRAHRLSLYQLPDQDDDAWNIG